MTPDRIRRAAEVLRQEAQSIKQSWAVDGTFALGHGSKRDRHDEMLALAAELEVLADARANWPDLPADNISADQVRTGGQPHDHQASASSVSRSR